MLAPELEAFLRDIHIFRDVNPADLSVVAKALEEQRYSPGDIITHQGTSARALYFIVQGKLAAVEIDDDGPETHRTIGGMGSIIGAWELINKQAWRSSIQAESTVVVYRWLKPAFSAFLANQPSVLERLRFVSNSQELASRLDLNWLNDEEFISAISRKHKIELVKALRLPGISLLAAGIIIFLNPFGSNFPSLWVAVAFALFALGLGAWNAIDWGNDFNIVTNRRALMLEKVIALYDNRQETPLQWVLAVSVSTTPLGRLLNYGEVIIRTYTGKLVFRNTANPNAMAAVLEEQWERYKQRRNLTDREEMVRTLQQRLSTDAQEKIDPPDADRTEATELSQTGRDRRGLRLADEEQNVVTYRKHWAILLRQVALPTIFFILLISLLALRLTEALREVADSTPTLIGAVGALILIIWWAYRYLDWANDIYQITPTHIVDISKKPLAREVRMIAPLDNILGTEIDRQGLLGVMLNFGSVIANVGATQFVFHGVSDPASVQQDIVFAQDALLKRHAETERVQRRDEVVEWLSAYHEEIRDKENLT